MNFILLLDETVMECVRDNQRVFMSKKLYVCFFNQKQKFYYTKSLLSLEDRVLPVISSNSCENYTMMRNLIIQL